MKSAAFFRVSSVVEVPISRSKRMPPAVFTAVLVTENSREFVGLIEDRVISKARTIKW